MALLREWLATPFEADYRIVPDVQPAIEAELRRMADEAGCARGQVGQYESLSTASRKARRTVWASSESRIASARAGSKRNPARTASAKSG